MIVSICKPVGEVIIPKYDGELSMIPFNLNDLSGVPKKFKALVRQMIKTLSDKNGVAFLTVHGKIINPGETQRRGGKHIDGNYLNINSASGWSNGWAGRPKNTASSFKGKSWSGSNTGNGWKVGEGGTALTTEEHKRSYLTKTGGMLIASTYPACRGWVGEFEGQPNIGGDCTHLDTGEGFMLKPNTVYFGNSQFIHESLQINEVTHRTIVRITLPESYEFVHN